ncbi:MAG: hypothetical protein WC683_20510 [bacterium]
MTFMILNGADKDKEGVPVILFLMLARAEKNGTSVQEEIAKDMSAMRDNIAKNRALIAKLRKTVAA